MLNPDGAERFQRRTAQSIDMNRDALTLGTPEARILKETRDVYDPQFGFNLHDQDPRYTVGNSKMSAQSPFLLRLLMKRAGTMMSDSAAKKVASVFLSAVNSFVPGHVSEVQTTHLNRAHSAIMSRNGERAPCLWSPAGGPAIGTKCSSGSSTM